MDFTNDLSFFGFAVTEQEQESFVVSSETDRNEHNVESGDQASHIKKQNAIKLTATLDVLCGETKKTLYDLQHFRG
ncbi:hypothetical protein DPMN_036383 [Dreissena polymorpha]|uniref:Uncharacterized protein n=1 Tax=Dreissena polymorpha TaxID=45954 RepID=A0A9D4MBF1_DREPO|nr:hypothetical protein DPMN_036383 [Dreissena polymorpha]